MSTILNRQSHSIIYMCLLCIFISSCRKSQSFSSSNTATVNVVNGIIQKNVLVKLNNLISSSGSNSSNNQQNTITFGANMFYFSEAKSSSIIILNRVDSSVLINKSVDLKSGGIYTLLLAGTTASDYDAVLIDDTNLPFVSLGTTPKSSDSVLNIRFINLSPDAGPININIRGVSTNEVSTLAYKGASPFKAYTASIANVSYIFEFRDATTNALLLSATTLSVNTNNRFKDLALVLRGMRTPASGQPALAVSTVNYFQ